MKPHIILFAVCVCVCMCVRACVRACMRACVCGCIYGCHLCYLVLQYSILRRSSNMPYLPLSFKCSCRTLPALHRLLICVTHPSLSHICMVPLLPTYSVCGVCRFFFGGGAILAMPIYIACLISTHSWFTFRFVPCVNDAGVKSKHNIYGCLTSLLSYKVVYCDLASYGVRSIGQTFNIAMTVS